jgi:hypothetical protein
VAPQQRQYDEEVEKRVVFDDIGIPQLQHNGHWRRARKERDEPRRGVCEKNTELHIDRK